MRSDKLFYHSSGFLIAIAILWSSFLNPTFFFISGKFQDKMSFKLELLVDTSVIEVTKRRFFCISKHLKLEKFEEAIFSPKSSIFASSSVRF